MKYYYYINCIVLLSFIRRSCKIENLIIVKKNDKFDTKSVD